MCNRYSKRSVTLVELLIAVALVAFLVLGITTLDTYARFHLVTSNRRVLLQNEMSFILEDMYKNIFRATGDITNPGIRDLGASPYCPSMPACPLTPASTGFCVRIDNSDPYTYIDDQWIYYFLSGNKIQKQVDGGSAEDLNKTDIITGFEYIVFCDGIGVDIILRARCTPSDPADPSLMNPQLEIKTRIYSHSASTS